MKQKIQKMNRQLLVKNLDGFPQKSNICLQTLMINLKTDITLKSFSFSVII